MTPGKFRELALSLPQTTESQQMSRTDFQVGGATFATLFADEQWGVIKLTRELQAKLVVDEPSVFEACNGAWGRNGATTVLLADADEGSILRALMSAWRKHAPAPPADSPP